MGRLIAIVAACTWVAVLGLWFWFGVPALWRHGSSGAFDLIFVGSFLLFILPPALFVYVLGLIEQQRREDARKLGRYREDRCWRGHW